MPPVLTIERVFDSNASPNTYLYSLLNSGPGPPPPPPVTNDDGFLVAASTAYLLNASGVQLVSLRLPIQNASGSSLRQIAVAVAAVAPPAKTARRRKSSCSCALRVP